MQHIHGFLTHIQCEFLKKVLYEWDCLRIIAGRQKKNSGILVAIVAFAVTPESEMREWASKLCYKHFPRFVLTVLLILTSISTKSQNHILSQVPKTTGLSLQHSLRMNWCRHLQRKLYFAETNSHNSICMLSRIYLESIRYQIHSIAVFFIDESFKV